MLDHVEIYVESLAESRRFYDMLLPYLGYHLYQEWSKGFSYKMDETYIVFVQTEATYRNQTYHRKHTGLNHLAFTLDSKESIDQLRAMFKDFGVNELYAHMYPHAGGYGYYALYFEDPDRIKLEVVLREHFDVEAFWNCVVAQDAQAMRHYFLPEAQIMWYATNETFTVESYLRANCEYPGTWTKTILKKTQRNHQLIATTQVTNLETQDMYFVTSYFTLKQGKIIKLEEYWCDGAQPPQWRRDLKG